MYCAPTAADCPVVTKIAKLTAMAAGKCCECTDCPTGCCPECAWTVCCPCAEDSPYCYSAENAEDCPPVTITEKLVKLVDGV